MDDPIKKGHEVSSVGGGVTFMADSTASLPIYEDLNDTKGRPAVMAAANPFLRTDGDFDRHCVFTSYVAGKGKSRAFNHGHFA